MKVLIALGGNALLRPDEIPTAELESARGSLVGRFVAVSLIRTLTVGPGFSPGLLTPLHGGPRGVHQRQCARAQRHDQGRTARCEGRLAKD